MKNPWYGEILALGLVLVAATGCGESSSVGASGPTAAATPAAQTEESEGPPEDAIAIKVDTVERGSLSALYSTSATLRADKRATVTARTQGVIQQLLVEEGDWTERGQPLAILEDDEHRIAYEQAKATAETRRREFERAETLHRQSLLSDEEFETSRRESVDARHATDLAELTLSRTIIRATFSGRVLTRHLDVGATVSDGTPVYDIADLDPLYADVQVPERQVAQLAAGQTVRLTTESNGNSLDEVAAIERIAPSVDPTSGTIKVTVAVNRAKGLRPGSFVRVGIVTDTHDDTLVVPRTALVAEGRRWHLFRVKADNQYQVELVEVTRGFEEAELVEIVGTVDGEQALNVGDRIVTTGASSLSHESAIKVLGDEPAVDADALADADEEPAETSEKQDEGQGVAS